jgi:hypothetical protein
MECPFCAETIKNEAIVCKHCARDLRVVRPLLLEVTELVADIEKLTYDLHRINTAIERRRQPLRYVSRQTFAYVLIPSLLLVAAHVLVTIALDISPFPLRLASVAIPLLFGVSSYPLGRIRLGGALLLAVSTASVSVSSMLLVTGINDSVPIFPESWVEWREVLEYGASIFLAFLSGNRLGIFIFRVFPRVLVDRGKPNSIAFRIARLLGPHLGEEQLRRRARLIQDLLQTAGPLAGVAATAIGSLYAGLKGILS